MVQWLRICLAMLGTQVRSLVQEDPTYLRATKPSATTTEARTLCLATREATMMRTPAQHNEGQPLLTATRESLHKATKSQHSQTIK